MFELLKRVQHDEKYLSSKQVDFESVICYILAYPMPKKRKSQKIIAELRRKLTAQEEEKTLSIPIIKEKKQIKKRLLMSTKSSPIFPSFIISDLKKSFFLTGLAISLEFVLYYLLELKAITKLSPLIEKIKW